MKATMCVECGAIFVAQTCDQRQNKRCRPCYRVYNRERRRRYAHKRKVMTEELLEADPVDVLDYVGYYEDGDL